MISIGRYYNNNRHSPDFERFVLMQACIPMTSHPMFSRIMGIPQYEIITMITLFLSLVFG